MNRPFLLSVALVAFVALTHRALAQPRPDAPAGRSREGTARALWDYQKELGLSVSQVAGLKRVVGRLQELLADSGRRAEALEHMAQELIESQGPLDEIRSRLQESSRLCLEMRMADIEAQREILQILEPDQLDRWRSIQASMGGSGENDPR